MAMYVRTCKCIIEKKKNISAVSVLQLRNRSLTAELFEPLSISLSLLPSLLPFLYTQTYVNDGNFGRGLLGLSKFSANLPPLSGSFMRLMRISNMCFDLSSSPWFMASTIDSATDSAYVGHNVT